MPFGFLRRLLAGLGFAEVHSGDADPGAILLGPRWAWGQRLCFSRSLLILLHLPPRHQRCPGRRTGLDSVPAPGPVSSPVQLPLGDGDGKVRRHPAPARHPEVSTPRLVSAAAA